MSVFFHGSSVCFPKPLSEEEETRYLDRYKNGDTQARNILIEHNLRLVAHVAKKYTAGGRFSSIDFDDIVSIGTIGLDVYKRQELEENRRKVKENGGFSYGKAKSMENLALSLPMTYKNRPVWDREFWRAQNGFECEIYENINQYVYLSLIHIWLKRQQD